ASQAARDAYNALYDVQNEGVMFMLFSYAKQELFEIVKAFHACKQEEGQSVSSYLLKMKSYLDTLERLGYAMPNELGVSLILNSLNKDYDQFIQNYNMHSMGKTIAELHVMLKRGAKGKDKGKNKLSYAPKPKIPPPPKRDNPAKDSVCHHCKEVGHWRRNCPSYQAELKKRKNASVASTSDNVFYFNAIPRDGIYEIDMHNLYPNVSSMFNVSNKRAKHALDSSYLWHCRLGHINKKRMDKLQRDGILQLTHDESLEKCKSCIFGKMARKPFPHQVERAKDLLGLIHTDVCGPFRTVSREGASYFITFTDDFSRYGYVYLMKHKHEVFETFKVFQNEVENQLGKKIKAIRSDRGGEYLSHEFVNHMKIYGILFQLTPPYTPQHNKVFERRNRTLLDMVRSMMNLTTLPKSFWGYALESAVRILNMVPTKKVERTTYEIWHGKAPNLMIQEASGSHGLLKLSGSDEELKLIQEEDTQPYENTSEVHNEVAPIEVEPQNLEVPICRSARIPPAPDRYGFYVDVEEYELGYLNEPPNYKAALSDLKSNQIMIWVLVELPLNGRTVRSKWLFKKKTDMDGKQASIIWNKKFDVEIKKIGFTQNPDEPCVYLKASGSNVEFLILTAVKTILKYLKNTEDMVLVYGENPEAELRVSCYADASFQTDKDDTKSQTGYVFVLNGGAVDWKSAK
ncbi:retrotransposon protein, putative, ty1-copia subclass, partial [Tanacetum coccineum]